MVKILLKSCITIGILLFIVSQIDNDKFINTTYGLNIFWLLLSLLVLFFQVLTSSFRWYLMLKIKNIDYTFFETLKLTWLGLFFNQILPTGIGGDVVRAHQLNKKCENLGLSISSVLWDRSTGLLGLGILILIGLPKIVYVGYNNLVLVSFVIVGILVISLLIVLYSKHIKFIKMFGISTRLDSLSRDARLFLLDKDNSIKVLGLSVITQSLSVVAVYLILTSIDVPVDIFVLLVVVPISIISMALPISIAGWGVREGVMVFGLSILGLGVEIALLVSIIYGVQLLLVSVPGGAYWIVFNNDKKTHE